MMIVADPVRCIVDIAFQGGAFAEQAARAHDFAAASFRFFARTGVSIPAIHVTENESYYIVRFESDELGFDSAHKAAVVLNAIAAGNDAAPFVAKRRRLRA